MIILDTNVVSEPMKPKASPTVASWLDQQVAESLFLTSTSLSELLTGIEILPVGKRKEALGSRLKELLQRLFPGRILPFDEEAAIAFASIVGRARAVGRSISVADAQIAAIAMVHDFSVATRDTAPFTDSGIHVMNPWDT